MNPHLYTIEQLVQQRQEAILRETALTRLAVQAPFRACLAAALIAFAQRLAPATPGPASIPTATAATGKL